MTQRDASVTLTFEGTEGAETYLRIEGMDYTDVKAIDLYGDDVSIDPNGLYTMETWKKLSAYTRNRQKADAKYEQPVDSLVLIVNAENTEEEEVGTSWNYLTSWSHIATGRRDFLVNLGYDDLAKRSITITFPEIGIYHMDRLQVLCQPMGHYIEQVSALREDVMQQVDLHDSIAGATNTVTGVIEVDEPKILCLTVPYSAGWEAYVDGEKQELLNANIMFCALELSPGSHDICLRYHTPGLRIGMCISGAGAVLLLISCLIRRRGRARHGEA